MRTTQLLLSGFIEVISQININNNLINFLVKIKEAGELVRRGLTIKHNASAAIGYREIMEEITNPQVRN